MLRELFAHDCVAEILSILFRIVVTKWQLIVEFAENLDGPASITEIDRELTLARVEE